MASAVSGSLALALVSILMMTVVAAATPNEFIIQASNYDKLSSHSNNCTFGIEADFAFTYC